MGPKAKKGKAEEEETPDNAEWRLLKNEADRLHKLAQKEEHDFNEFQQQREKLNYFWIVEKKKHQRLCVEKHQLRMKENS